MFGSRTARGTRSTRPRMRTAAATLGALAAIATGAVVAPPASAAPATPTAGTAGHGQCLDVNSSEVKRGLRQIGPPLGRSDLHWVLRNRTTARTNCPPLMFAVFDTSGGTGSSPTAVLLFRPGKFLGAANAKPTAFTNASASSPWTVNVTYRWLRGNDPTANPTGGPTTVVFFAVGDSLYHFGQMPPGA